VRDPAGDDVVVEGGFRVRRALFGEVPGRGQALLVRPEHARLVDGGEATIVDVMLLGADRIVVVARGGCQVRVRERSVLQRAIGARVDVVVDEAWPLEA
jgi:hypothetical protein